MRRSTLFFSTLIHLCGICQCCSCCRSFHICIYCQRNRLSFWNSNRSAGSQCFCINSSNILCCTVCQSQHTIYAAILTECHIIWQNILYLHILSICFTVVCYCNCINNIFCSAKCVIADICRLRNPQLCFRCIRCKLHFIGRLVVYLCHIGNFSGHVVSDCTSYRDLHRFSCRNVNFIRKV